HLVAGPDVAARLELRYLRGLTVERDRGRVVDLELHHLVVRAVADLERLALRRDQRAAQVLLLGPALRPLGVQLRLLLRLRLLQLRGLLLLLRRLLLGMLRQLRRVVLRPLRLEPLPAQFRR